MYPQRLHENENVDDYDAADGDAVKYFQYGSKSKKRRRRKKINIFMPQSALVKNIQFSLTFCG